MPPLLVFHTMLDSGFPCPLGHGIGHNHGIGDVVADVFLSDQLVNPRLVKGFPYALVHS